MTETRLEIWAGESRTWTLTVWAAGELADLTNAVIEFAVKVREGSTGAPLILMTSTGDGITILDQSVPSGTRGQARINLVPVDTSGPAAPVAGVTYRHETVITFPSGERKYLVRGDFVLRRVVNPPIGAGVAAVGGAGATASAS